MQSSLRTITKFYLDPVNRYVFLGNGRYQVWFVLLGPTFCTRSLLPTESQPLFSQFLYLREFFLVSSAAILYVRLNISNSASTASHQTTNKLHWSKYLYGDLVFTQLLRPIQLTHCFNFWLTSSSTQTRKSVISRPWWPTSPCRPSGTTYLMVAGRTIYLMNWPCKVINRRGMSSWSVNCFHLRKGFLLEIDAWHTEEHHLVL